MMPTALSWHSMRVRKSESLECVKQRQSLISILEKRAFEVRNIPEARIDELYLLHFKGDHSNRTSRFLSFLFAGEQSDDRTSLLEPKGRKIAAYLGYGVGLWGSVALFEGIKAFVSDGMKFLGVDDEAAAQTGNVMAGILIGYRFFRNARNTSSMSLRLYDTITDFKWFKQSKVYNNDIHAHVSNKTKFNVALFSWAEGVFWSLPWVVFTGYSVATVKFWMMIPAMLVAEGSFLGLQFDKELLNLVRMKNTKSINKKSEKRRTTILETIDEIRNVLHLMPSSTISVLYQEYKKTSSS